MAAAALKGKARNDWMRRTQAFLALQAYGDLVRNFPDKYDAQTTEMKEIYDTLVAKIDVPVGLDRGHLLVQWQGANKTEMSGAQLITKAKDTRCEIRERIVPAAQTIMVNGKNPSGKSDEETLGLIKDLLWAQYDADRVKKAEARHAKQPDDDGKDGKKKRGPRAAKPIRPADFEPHAFLAFTKLAPIWNPNTPWVFRPMLDPTSDFAFTKAEKAAMSRTAMREARLEKKGWVNKQKILKDDTQQARRSRALASRIAAASFALTALEQQQDRREARLEKALRLEQDPDKQAALKRRLMAVLTTEIAPSSLLTRQTEDDEDEDDTDLGTSVDLDSHRDRDLDSSRDIDAADLDTTRDSGDEEEAACATRTPTCSPARISPRSATRTPTRTSPRTPARRSSPAVSSASPIRTPAGASPRRTSAGTSPRRTPVGTSPRRNPTRTSPRSGTPTPTRTPRDLAASLRHAASQGEQPDPALVAMAVGRTKKKGLARSASVRSDSEGGEMAAISRGEVVPPKRARTADYAALSGRKSNK